MVPIHIRYVDRFDGVLLMHEVSFLIGKDKEGKPIYERSDRNDQIAEPVSYGKIMNGLVPYFSVQVHATLLLFSPQPDMILGKLVCFVNLSTNGCSISVDSRPD
jgi:hypothetical protein